MQTVLREDLAIVHVERDGLMAADIGVGEHVAEHPSDEEAGRQVAVRKPHGRGENDAEETGDVERAHLSGSELDANRHATRPAVGAPVK